MGSKLPSALSALLILLVVLASGCTLSRGKSSSADTTTASALVRDAPGLPSDTCMTSYLLCTNGYRVLSVTCTSGYNFTEPCPKVNSGPWSAGSAASIYCGPSANS